MRSSERLKRQKKGLPPPGKEAEDGMELPRFVPLNRAKSTFDNGSGKAFGGINTAPSAFDKGAVFRTE